MLMSRKETKLLVENWKATLNKSEEECILEESYLKAGIGMLSLIGSLLGQASSISVADAMPSRDVAETLNTAFNKKSPGNFRIIDRNGDVIGIHNKSGKEQLILTDEQCENISEEELEDALYSLENESYKSYREKLLKASESAESEISNSSKVKGKRSFLDRIKLMSESDKKRLIDEFTQGEFNLQASQMKVAARGMYEKSQESRKKFESLDNAFIFFIIHMHPNYADYLPK